MESSEKLNEEEALKRHHDTEHKLKLSLQHNVQVMGMLQRYQNEGPHGIKESELHANDDTVDSTGTGTEESYDLVSRDNSIDLDDKDSTQDRNILSAKEAG